MLNRKHNTISNLNAFTAKKLLKLPVSTRNELALRELYLEDPIAIIRKRVWNYYFKIEFEQDNSLLQACFQILEAKPKTHGSVFKNIKSQLEEFNCEELLNLPLKIEVHRALTDSFENINCGIKMRIAASLEGHYKNIDPLFTSKDFDKALTYQKTLSNEQARCIAMIRTNSLLKPFQFMGNHGICCIFCKSRQRFASNKTELTKTFESVLDVLKHSLFDCAYAPIKTISFRETEQVDWNRCLETLENPDSSQITDFITHTASAIRRNWLRFTYPKDGSSS